MVKHYKSAESYRKFRAYTHMRTPTGKMARSRSQTISAKTPISRKERVIKVAGRTHRPKLTTRRK